MLGEMVAPSTDQLLAHTDWLLALSRALVGDAAAADVVQQTYEVALTKPPKREGPVRPWLGGVARNLARMTVRGRTRQARREEAAIDVGATVPTPEELLARAQMQQQVAKLVLELPEPLRATLLLRFFEGLSAAEIARAQGIPESTVRGRIKDALDRVRASLDQQTERKRWVLLLAPLPVVAARDVAASAVLGGLVVKTQVKVVIVLVVALLAVLGTRWLGWWGGGKSEDASGSAVASGTGGSAKPAPIQPTITASKGGPARQQLPIFDDDPKGTLRIEGQVIDEQDAPVAGAHVAIDSHPTIVVESDASGNFVFEGLMPRDYRIEATGGERYAGPARLRLTDKAEPVTLRMKKAGTVEVIVTEIEGGKPVAGATVELRSTLTWTAKTDAKGTAMLRGVGSVWAPLVVSAPGFANSAIMLSTSGDPAAPAKVTLALAHGAALSGRVVDEEGKPVGDARVVATSASEPFPVVDPRRDGVQTKADGTFTFPVLAAGTWRLTASDTKHGPATSPPITVDGIHARSGVELALTAGGLVRGKVTDKGGKPVAAAEIRVVAKGHVDWRARRQALSGADGTFAIAGLPLRAMDVVASHDAGASAIATVDLAAKAEADVTLTLDVTGEIAGTVVDAKGAPIGDAQVYAAPEWTGNVTEREVWSVRGFGEAVTDQGGAFKLTGLPDGNYKLRATRPGASEAAMSLVEPVMARPGGGPIKLVVPGDGRVIGKVALDGKPVARFTVEIGDLEMPFSGDSFALPVAAGKHTVVVRGPGFVTKAVPDVAVSDSKDTDVGTIAVAAGRSVSGRVLDAQGAPVAKAKVAAGALLTGGGKELYIPDESINAKDTDTDDDGRFTLDGFNPGPITIVAGNATGRSPSIQIPRGPDSATVELVLQPTTGLDGKVMREGKPAGDVVIIANPLGALGSNFFTTTGPDGTFALDAIAPGTYIVYPMFGGGGPRPKDIYVRRVEVVRGARAKVEIDATPGTAALTINVKNFDGTPAGAQVITIQAAIEPTSLDELREGVGVKFSDKEIPIYMRGAMAGSVEITTARPGIHTTCTMGFGGNDDPNKPFACKKVELAAGAKRTLDLVLPKPK